MIIQQTIRQQPSATQMDSKDRETVIIQILAQFAPGKTTCLRLPSNRAKIAHELHRLLCAHLGRSPQRIKFDEMSLTCNGKPLQLDALARSAHGSVVQVAYRPRLLGGADVVIEHLEKKAEVLAIIQNSGDQIAAQASHSPQKLKAVQMREKFSKYGGQLRSMIIKKNQDGLHLYDPIKLEIRDYSSATTVKKLVKLAKEQMDQDMRKNYKWKLNEIKDITLPSKIDDYGYHKDGDHNLSELESFKDKIAIQFTIYGYPVVKEEDELIYENQDQAEEEVKTLMNQDRADESIKFAANVLMLNTAKKKKKEEKKMQNYEKFLRKIKPLSLSQDQILSLGHILFKQQGIIDQYINSDLDEVEFDKVLHILSKVQLQEFIFNLRRATEIEGIQSDQIHLIFPEQNENGQFEDITEEEIEKLLNDKNRIRQMMELTDKYEITQACVTKLLDTLSSSQWCRILFSILEPGDVTSASGTKIGRLFRTLGLGDRDANFLQNTRDGFNFYDQYRYSTDSELDVFEADQVVDEQRQTSIMWDLLGREERKFIWSQLSDDKQMFLLNGHNIYLSAQQQVQLFLDFSLQEQRKYWEGFQIQQRQKIAILKSMRIQDTIKLFEELTKMVDVPNNPKKTENIVRFIDLLYQAEIQTKFWNLCSERVQEEIIKVISYAAQNNICSIENPVAIMKDLLLGTLSLKELSLAENMHQILTNNPELLSFLTHEQKRDILSFQRYGVSSSLDTDPAKIIQRLFREQYQSFQSIPMARPREQEFVQCIPNPAKKNGFITVEDIKGFPNADKETCQTTSEKQKTINKADESPIIFGYTCEHMSNERLRMMEQQKEDENSLTEVEPCRARCAQLCSMISYWEYTIEKGIQCKHSFFIPNRCTKLFTGHNGEVFYFEKEIDHERAHLTLHILNLQRPANVTGEDTRRLINNCKSYRIRQGGHLHREILNDYAVPQQNSAILKFYLKPDPTIIESGNGNKILVYPSATPERASLQFYDLEARRSFASIEKAEALIDCYTDSEQHSTHLVYLKKEKILDMKVDFKKLLDSVDLKQEEELKMITQQAQETTKLNWELDLKDEMIKYWNKRYNSEYEGKFQIRLHDKYKRNPNDSESEGHDQQDQGRTDFFSFLIPGVWSITFQWFPRQNREYRAIRVVENTRDFMTTILHESSKNEGVYAQIVRDNELIIQKIPSYSKKRTSNLVITENDQNIKYKVKQLDEWHLDQVSPLLMVEYKEVSNQPQTAQDEYDELISEDVDINRMIIGGVKLIQPRKRQEKQAVGDPKPENEVTYGAKQLRWIQLQLPQKISTKQKFEFNLHELREFKHKIMYPMVAYSGLAQDNREIIYANLSDKEYPQQIIHLPDGCQFVCFVGSSTYTSELYMLLERDKEGCSSANGKENCETEFYIFVIEKRKPFKKQRIGDPEQHDFELKFQQLENNGGLTGQDILQAEYMYINNEDLLVVRTKDAILALFPDKVEGAEYEKTHLLSSKNILSINHPMQRGYADSIFWIEETSVQKNQLKGVRFEEQMESMSLYIAVYETYSVPEGKIKEFTVQMRESEFSTISFYREQRQVDQDANLNEDDLGGDKKAQKNKNKPVKITREYRKDFKNQDILIFVEKMNTMQELKANLKGTNNAITKAGNKLQNMLPQKKGQAMNAANKQTHKMMKIDQLALKDLLCMDQQFFDSYRMDKYQLQILDEQFMRDFFAQVEQKNKNLDFSIMTEDCLCIRMKQVIIFKNIEKDQMCLIDTTSAEFHKAVLGNQKLRRRKDIHILSDEPIQFTNRRVMMLEVNCGSTKRFIMVSYSEPNNRMHDIIGSKGNSHLKEAFFLTKHKILLNFRYLNESYKIENYWTVMNTDGQIKPMPIEMQQYTSASCYNQIDGGKYLLFQNKQTFSMYKFNQRGEPQQRTTFNRFLLRRFLKREIEDKLSSIRGTSIFRSTKKDEQLKKQDKDMIKNLRFLPMVITSQNGEIYRFACFTVQDPESPAQQIFTDNKQLRTHLWGIYEMRISEADEDEITGTDEHFLRILIFQCQNESHRKLFYESSFAICGLSLCYWSQLEPQHIHIMDLQPLFVLINKEVDKPFTAQEFLSKTQKRKRDEDEEQTSIVDSQTNNEEHKTLLSRRDSLAVLEEEKVMLSDVYQPKSTRIVILKKEIETKKIYTKGMVQDEEKNNFSLILSTYDDLTQRLNVEKQAQAGPQEKLDTLLQVSSSQTAFVFDISQVVPNEVSYVDETEFFFEPEFFPTLNFQKFQSKNKKNIINQINLWDQIETNRDKSMYIFTQRDEKSQKHKQIEKRQEPESKGIFRSYSMMDLNELANLQSFISTTEELEMNVIQLVKTVFGRHTVFSVLQYNEDHMTKIMNVIAEETENVINLAGNAAEAQLDTEFVRILYRVFNIPTPDFQGQTKGLLKNKTAADRPDHEKAIRRSKHQTIDMFVNPNDNDVIDTREQLLKNQVRQAKQKPNRVLAFTQKLKNRIKRRGNKGAKQVVKLGKDAINIYEFKTAFQRVMFQSQRLRDQYLKLAELSTEFRISDFAGEQRDVTKMIQAFNTTLQTFLDGQIRETPWSRKIAEIKWSTSCKKRFLTFRKHTQVITQKEVEAEIMEILLTKFQVSTSALRKTEVDVFTLNIDWLLRDRKNFLKFNQSLSSKSSRIFTTRFMQTLVEEFWDKNFTKILWLAFLPWMLYMICTIQFFSVVLDDAFGQNPESKTEDYFYKWVTGLAILTLLVWQFYIEWLQFKGDGYSIKAYIKNIFNLLDLMQLFSTVFIVLENLYGFTDMSNHNIRMIATFSIFILWMKVFDWLRLFESTSFYYKLVVATFVDIKEFMILFITALCMVGSSMYILEMSREKQHSAIIDSLADHFLLDAIYNQYLLSLGPAPGEGFDDHPTALLIYLFFIFASFFLTIVFLNMLIAIMGNTFSFVIERKMQYALMTKLSIMSEYYFVIDTRNPEQDNDNHLFVVMPAADGDDEEGEEWEGGFSFLKNILRAEIKQLGISFTSLLLHATLKIQEDQKEQIQGIKEELTKMQSEKEKKKKSRKEQKESEAGDRLQQYELDRRLTMRQDSIRNSEDGDSPLKVSPTVRKKSLFHAKTQSARDLLTGEQDTTNMENMMKRQEQLLTRHVNEVNSDLQKELRQVQEHQRIQQEQMNELKSIMQQLLVSSQERYQ